jgi:hypothetical protein
MEFMVEPATIPRYPVWHYLGKNARPPGLGLKGCAMPPKAKLSIFEIQSILQQRIQSCGLCGGSNWELEPDLSILRLGNPYMPREGRKLRCVLLSCHDCGNTHLINIDMLSPVEESERRDVLDTVAIAGSSEDAYDDEELAMADKD